MNRRELISGLANIYYGQRHGKSLANQEEIISSDPNIGKVRYGLVAEGKLQVAETALKASNSRMLGSGVVIWTSDFLRTRETSVITRDIIGARIVISHPKLRERFFGVYEGTSNTNYDQVWKEDAKNPVHTAGDVESVNSVMERTTALIKELEDIYWGFTVLLVSHGDVLQILEAALKGFTPPDHQKIKHLRTGEIRRLSR